VAVHPRRAPAEEEGRAAGDSEHAAVESPSPRVAHVPGDDGHVDLLGDDRIAVVAFCVAVDERDGDRRVAASVQRVLATLVRVEARLQPAAEVVVEGDDRAILAQWRRRRSSTQGDGSCASPAAIA
jgi:hypothetical protein